MAKRVVKWGLDATKTILQLSKALEDPKSEVVIEASFNITLLYPDFGTMSDVQQQLILYGTKQKLMDVGAGVGEEGSKISAAKKKWQELLDGKFAGERVNSTGAAEAKKAVAAVKEASKAVTLQGLTLKKVMADFGGEKFTEEDEAKLQEFIQIAAGAGKKAKA